MRLLLAALFFGAFAWTQSAPALEERIDKQQVLEYKAWADKILDTLNVMVMMMKQYNINGPMLDNAEKFCAKLKELSVLLDNVMDINMSNFQSVLADCMKKYREFYAIAQWLAPLFKVTLPTLPPNLPKREFEAPTLQERIDKQQVKEYKAWADKILDTLNMMVMMMKQYNMNGPMLENAEKFCMKLKELSVMLDNVMDINTSNFQSVLEDCMKKYRDFYAIAQWLAPLFKITLPTIPPNFQLKREFEERENRLEIGEWKTWASKTREVVDSIMKYWDDTDKSYFADSIEQLRDFRVELNALADFAEAASDEETQKNFASFKDAAAGTFADLKGAGLESWANYLNAQLPDVPSSAAAGY